MADSLKEQVKKAQEEYSPSDITMGFLNLIADNSLGEKNKKDIKNEAIRELFNEGFDINDPTGTKKIGSKVIQQALWRVMSKAKFLDCIIHGTGKDENIERMVTEGVMTVADRGGLAENFSGKCGVLMNAFMYGDGFLMFGKGTNDENPVSFQVLRNEDVFADSFAYGVRGVNPASKLCAIRQYDKDEAYELWPELEEEGAYGRIPGTYQSSDRVTDREQNDILEVCWGWNLPKKCHQIFAGSQVEEIETYEGEEYPFEKNSKPYIPIFQFMCQPGIDGFWNHGIGEMVFDLAVITRKLLNLEVTHITKNVNPITLINAPQAKVDELVEKLAMAHEAEKQGAVPYVAMEFDPNGGNQNAAAQALLTQNLFNEWQAVWDRLYRELSRLGINLDDIERGSGITRGQVIAEEQASNAFVLQMMEYNSNETEELIECIMDAITEFVSPKNKTSLNLMTNLMLPDGMSAKIDMDVTMGMLSKTLKDGNWFCKADSRSGAILSELSKMVHEERLIAMTPPGSPAYNNLYRSIAMRMGVNSRLDNAPQPQGGAQPGGAQPPIPAETQRSVPAPLGNVMTPV